MQNSLSATSTLLHKRISVGASNLPQAKTGGTRPFALTLVVLTLFFPVEASFYIMGLRLTATRLVFLVLAPILVAQFFSRVSNNRYRFVLSDLFVVLTGFWFIFAPSNVIGLPDALNHAGPEALEFCIGYFATRLLLSKHGQALSIVQLLCRVIAIVALVGLLDPLTGHSVSHEFLGRLTGYVTPGLGGDEYRMGILRASGPVEHPIWFGFICGMGLLMATSLPLRSRRFIAVASSLGLVMSISSAPLQCTFLGFGLLVYNRLTSGIRFKWMVLISVGVLLMILIFTVAENPIGFVISHFIYDPTSGYYRYWTWDRVIYYVSYSPWFGLGFGQMPEEIDHSIDALWLVLAIHYGWTGAVLVALSLIGTVSLPVSGQNVNLTRMESRLGTMLGIIIFLTLYISFTVHLLGILWVLTALLAGIRAHLGELGRLPRSAAA